MWTRRKAVLHASLHDSLSMQEVKGTVEEMTCASRLAARHEASVPACANAAAGGLINYGEGSPGPGVGPLRTTLVVPGRVMLTEVAAMDATKRTIVNVRNFGLTRADLAATRTAKDAARRSGAHVVMLGG